MQRRNFLMHAGALAGTAALGQMGVFAARAAAATDYKALVCLFLYGGNDSNNMVIPVDAAGYANYAKIRADLALPQAQLLPLQDPAACCAMDFTRRFPDCRAFGRRAISRWLPMSAPWCSRSPRLNICRTRR